VETFFPLCGKIPKTFSIVWKKRQKFFHCMEKTLKVFPLRGKNGPVFPQCGKYFSIAWKNREKVFHTVENSTSKGFPSHVRAGLLAAGFVFSRH